MFEKGGRVSQNDSPHDRSRITYILGNKKRAWLARLKLLRKTCLVKHSPHWRPSKVGSHELQTAAHTALVGSYVHNFWYKTITRREG